MTNAEKFKEVFGFDIDKDCCPFGEDKFDQCEECTYYDQIKNQNMCSQVFWNEEYTHGENTGKPEVIISFPKGTLKFINKDYVVFDKDWLLKNCERELDIQKLAADWDKYNKIACEHGLIELITKEPTYGIQEPGPIQFRVSKPLMEDRDENNKA